MNVQNFTIFFGIEMCFYREILVVFCSNELSAFNYEEIMPKETRYEYGIIIQF